MEKLVEAAAGGLVSTVIGNIFGGNDKPETAPPAPSEPTVMPNADDEAVKQAKRRSVAAQIARRGRASTILTDTGSEKLGG